MALPVPAVTNHAPVTGAMVASAVAAILMQYARQKFGVDFTGLEPQIQTVAVAIGYFFGKGGA